MKKFVFKRKYLYIIIPVVLIMVLGFWIWSINMKARGLDKYSEVTFISPTQAIVFWKSEESTLGFIKYGESRFRMKETALQTSSEEGEIHVVFLENIPLDGMYISKHNESDSFLIFPKVEYIKYDSNALDE